MKLLRELLYPLIAVVCAMLVGAAVVLFIGDSPLQTYRLLLGSAFSWPDGIGYTLFFATPLIYSYAAIPEGSPLRRALRLNPMTHVAVMYQQVLFHGNVDHWRGLFLALLVGVVAFAVGAFLFDRLRDTLPEEV